jgi:transposase
MPIITWMGDTVLAYLDSHYDWWDKFLLVSLCSQCHCLFRRHSERSRAAWSDFLHRDRERIPILRIYCPLCGTTHTVLPDFLTPRHRYQVPVREAVVVKQDHAPPCCAQTVRRWKAAFRQVIAITIQQIISWILTDCLPLSRPERIFLTGKIHHDSDGLRAVRRLAEAQGRDSDASCLFGWVNREFGAVLAFTL